jgi:hypothetical protein
MQNLGFRDVWGSEPRVQNLGLRVKNLGFRVEDLESRVQEN